MQKPDGLYPAEEVEEAVAGIKPLIGRVFGGTGRVTLDRERLVIAPNFDLVGVQRPLVLGISHGNTSSKSKSPNGFGVIVCKCGASDSKEKGPGGIPPGPCKSSCDFVILHGRSSRLFNFLDRHNSFLDGVHELASQRQIHAVANIQQNRLFIVRR